MTELSFLIELLLNHDLPKATKDLIASRIKEVEANLVQRPQQLPAYIPPSNLPKQAPSTLALMAKHGDIAGMVPHPDPIVAPPVEVIAQTPATAAAMNHRQETIAAAIAGKVDKVTGRPRKW